MTRARGREKVAERDAAAEGEGARPRRDSRRLLAALLRPHRRAVAVLVAAIVVSNGAGLAIPYLVKVGIDLGVPALGGRDGAVTPAAVAGAILAATLAQAVTRRAFLRLSGRIGQDILLELRRGVFDHFQRLSLSFHQRYTSGRAVSRLTSDIEAIAELLQSGLDGIVTALLTMIGTAVLLLVLDPRPGLVALVPLPALWLLTRWFRRESAVAHRRTREAVAAMIARFAESMGGIRAVQAFRGEARDQRAFGALNAKYRAANTGGFQLIAIFMPGVTLAGHLTVTAVLVYGGWLAAKGAITVGVLAAFLLYLRRFYEPMQEISQFYTTLQSAYAALEKLSGVLAEAPGVADPAEPVALPRPRGHLRFEGVEFSYVEGVPVLPGLDLAIPAGQTVAVVGASGAGKTTLAGLVARLHDPTAGRVLLDGVDLRHLDEATLRRAVVLVPQETVLFGGTVADNIRFGRPAAPMADVVAAAAAVGAHEFISALPRGYGTEVGGGRLSAGQRQLLAFARAFLADPAVLILDEATSALDLPAERLARSALRTILAGRTALIIAHRPSTVEIADRVLVVRDGRVAEDGPPGSPAAPGPAGTGRARPVERDGT